MLVKKEKSFDLRAVKNEFRFCFIKNCRVFVLAGIIFFTWVFFSILLKKRFYEEQIHVNFCQLDGYVLMDNIVMKGWVLFPVALYLFSVFVEPATYQFLIRKSSRVIILRTEEWKIVILSLYLIVVQVITIYTICTILCKNGCNWMQNYSVFWFETGQIIKDIPSYGYVVFRYCLNNFLDYLLLGYIYILIGYCYNCKRIAYLIEVVIVVFRIGIRDYLSVDGVWYSQWISWDYSMHIYKLVLLIGLLVVCKKTIMRKDFYCE